MYVCAWIAVHALPFSTMAFLPQLAFASFGLLRLHAPPVGMQRFPFEVYNVFCMHAGYYAHLYYILHIHQCFPTFILYIYYYALVYYYFLKNFGIFGL